MSGGSYNYLYCHVRGLEEQRDDIKRMAERLQASGYYGPARATRNILVLLDGAERAAQALEDVWLAVEWADSGDSSEDRVREAAAKVEPWPPEVSPAEHAQQSAQSAADVQRMPAR